jgi:hypothetical protein
MHSSFGGFTTLANEFLTDLRGILEFKNTTRAGRDEPAAALCFSLLGSAERNMKCGGGCGDCECIYAQFRFAIGARRSLRLDGNRAAGCTGSRPKTDLTITKAQS